LELPRAALEAAPAVCVRALDALQRGRVGRPACGAACETDGRPYDHEGPEIAPDHGCEGLDHGTFLPPARSRLPAAEVESRAGSSGCEACRRQVKRPGQRAMLAACDPPRS